MERGAGEVGWRMGFSGWGRATVSSPVVQESAAGVPAPCKGL